MKEKGLDIQYKVIKSILKHLEQKVPIIDEKHKMKSYVAYLAERTTIKPKRIRRILDDDINKRLTISECNEIAHALGLNMYTLCSFDD